MTARPTPGRTWMNTGRTPFCASGALQFGIGTVTIPILPSADFDVTSAFWSRFGFHETGRWPDEYLIMRHEVLDVELHFWSNPAADRWTNDVGCYIRFDSPSAVLACHTSWADVVVPEPANLSSPEPGPKGSIEFHIIDPHGNLVRLGGF